MSRKLILIRGLPGSGKSTLAKKLVEDIGDAVHIEADQYFTDAQGNYHFDRSQLSAAHENCLQRAWNMLACTTKTVIVANTFVKYWEMVDYIDAARKFNVPVEIIHCKGEYKSIHNVPQETIERMKRNFEGYIYHD